MITAFLLMTAGACIAMFMRRKRWWLKVHKLAGFLAALFVICGFALAVSMVIAFDGEHFRVPHAYLGLATIALAVLTPVLGYLLLRKSSPARGTTHLQSDEIDTKAGSSRRLTPAAHRWSGRATVILACTAVASGLHIVGLFDIFTG